MNEVPSESIAQATEEVTDVAENFESIDAPPVAELVESFQESGILRLGRKRIEILDRSALDRVHRAELS